MGNQESIGIGRTLLHEVINSPRSSAEISLRFLSPFEHPVEITDLLGIEPTTCHAPSQSLDGTETSLRLGCWMWVIRGGPDASIPGGIDYMLSRLPEDQPLWQRLTTKYQADIFCEFGISVPSTSLGLSALTMQGLVRRNLTLTLDIATVR
jgi:hypothetical protein